MSVESAKTTIQMAVMRRNETDSIMSGAWILIIILQPILLFFGVILFLVGLMLYPIGIGLMLIGLPLMILGILIGLILIYKLVKRRTEHFKRSRLLREGLLQYIESRGSSEGKTSEIQSHLSAMRMIHSELVAREGEKSPGLYTILTFITGWIVGLYVMYFLTKDFVEHDSREIVFYKEASEALNKLGISITFPHWKGLPKRSAGLYIILTLVTGVFGIYWFWVLIKDPNQHFETHRIFEDMLVSAI